MGFMNATFYGYAKKFIVGNRCFEDVFVELNLKDGEINLYIQEPSKTSLEPLLKNEKDLHKLNNSNLQLLDVEIFTPLLKLRAKTITEIFISSMNFLPAFHIGGTFTIRAFNLIPAFSSKKSVYGYYKIMLTPKQFLEFEIENINYKREGNLQEILFKNFYLGIAPPVAFSNLYQNYGIILKEVREAGLFSISFINYVENIEDYSRAFRIALSYVQGREVDELLIVNNRKLQVFFVNSLGSGIFSLIPTYSIHDRNWFEEYLICFLNYWKKLSTSKKNIFSRMIINLIYSKTRDAEIESKFAHLFTVFEIICEGKVEKSKLKKEMKIPFYDAKFIVSLRNKILHGFSFEEAITYAFQESEKESDRSNSIFLKLKKVVDIKNKNVVSCLKVYYALIKLLDTYVLNQIGYTGKWYNPLNEFSEEYIKEILLEDEELLQELKNR